MILIKYINLNSKNHISFFKHFILIVFILRHNFKISRYKKKCTELYKFTLKSFIKNTILKFYIFKISNIFPSVFKTNVGLVHKSLNFYFYLYF